MIMYKSSFTWFWIKLFVLALLIIILWISNASISCTSIGNTVDDYYECHGICWFELHPEQTCATIRDSSMPAGYNSIDECTTDYTYTASKNVPSTGYYPDRYCYAKVESKCMNTNYAILLGVLVSQAVLQCIIHLYFADSDYDPQVDMIDIANSLKLSGEAVAILTHPLLCALSILEVVPFVLLPSVAQVCCATICTADRSPLAIVTLIALVVCEGCAPLIVNAMRVCIDADSWAQDKRPVFHKVISLFRLDLLLVYNFLRVMQVVVCPVSALAYFSTKKHKRQQKKQRKAAQMATSSGVSVTAPRPSEHLDFALRNGYSSMMFFTANGGDNADGIGMLKSERQSGGNMMRRLFSRYTVLYSFIKLVASIVLSLLLNDGYSYCKAGYMTAEQCPSGCTAHCAFPTTHHTNAISPYTRQCNPDLAPDGYSSVHNECFCDNWLSTDFIVLIMNVAHYLLQCYYYLHFNNFDPQQNQIDCVQSYTFVGDNIMLFLTHPAISLLSVLESIILVASWSGVLRHDGLSCDDGVTAPGVSDYHSLVLFAIFMTFIEVYKANMTVAVRHWQAMPTGSEWHWALFSLLRVDLFLFYGSTLFLQTFLFPFSIVGYFMEQYNRTVASDESEYVDKGDAGSNYEALLPTVEEENEDAQDSEDKAGGI